VDCYLNLTSQLAMIRLAVYRRSSSQPRLRLRV